MKPVSGSGSSNKRRSTSACERRRRATSITGRVAGAQRARDARGWYRTTGSRGPAGCPSACMRACIQTSSSPSSRGCCRPACEQQQQPGPFNNAAATLAAASALLKPISPRVHKNGSALHLPCSYISTCVCAVCSTWISYRATLTHCSLWGGVAWIQGRTLSLYMSGVSRTCSEGKRRWALLGQSAVSTVARWRSS